MPPLRERREDIPLLVSSTSFMQALLRATNEKPARELSGGSRRSRLLEYPWPGNVRELRNVAERFVLGLADEHLLAGAATGTATLAQQLDQVEKVLIERALKRHQGRMNVTCEALGIARKTLYDKIARLHIDVDDYRGGAGDG